MHSKKKLVQKSRKSFLGGSLHWLTVVGLEPSRPNSYFVLQPTPGAASTSMVESRDDILA
jgi:hypothetical protein